MQLSPRFRDRLTYAFGHLVASHNPEDPHHADSGELGEDVLDELGLDAVQRATVLALAEHVAGNYQWTGEAVEVERKIKAGEL